MTIEDGKSARKSAQLPPPHLVPHAIIHVRPPLVLHNLLPYEVHYSIDGSTTGSEAIGHGDHAHVHTADVTGQPRIMIQVCACVHFLELNQYLNQSLFSTYGLYVVKAEYGDNICMKEVYFAFLICLIL